MFTESWLLLALVGFLISGFLSFIGKISAEKKHDSSFILFYAFLFQTPLSFLAYLFYGSFQFSYVLLFFSVFAGITVFYMYKLRIMALEHVSTSFFFINYRIFSSILILLLGFIFYSEYLTSRDYLGIIVGFLVFFALLGGSSEKTIKNKLSLGLLYTSIVTLIAAIMPFLLKEAELQGFGIVDYVFFLNICGVIFSSIINRKKLNKKYLFENKNQIVLYGFLQSMLMLGLVYFTGFAYAWGTTVIAYKIVSFSLLIPIILSVLIYKEKMTKRKLLAIFLALISIALFL